MNPWREYVQYKRHSTLQRLMDLRKLFLLFPLSLSLSCWKAGPSLFMALIMVSFFLVWSREQSVIAFREREEKEGGGPRLLSMSAAFLSFLRNSNVFPQFCLLLGSLNVDTDILTQYVQYSARKREENGLNLLSLSTYLIKWLTRDRFRGFLITCTADQQTFFGFAFINSYK